MNANIQEIFRKNTTRIKSIAFHPKQSCFITGNHCGMIYIWDLDFSMIIDSLSEHQGSVRCISIHPSGELFASCGDDNIVRVWNFKTRSVVMRLKGHSDFVRSVNFHPTQPLVVSGSDDHSVIVWNYYSGEIVKSEMGHNHYVMSTVFLDANTIASASLDHKICVWGLGDLSNKYITRLELHQTISAHERGINSLFFKNGILISGSDDKEVKMWNYKNGKLEMAKVFYAAEGNVTCTIENNGEIMAVTEDGQLNIYNGNDSYKIEHGSRLWAVAGHNNHLIVGSDDGLVVYRKKINTAGTQMGNKLFYKCKNRLMCYDMDKQKAKEWCDLKENVTQIRPGRDSSVIVEYTREDNNSNTCIEYFVVKHDEDNKLEYSGASNCNEIEYTDNSNEIEYSDNRNDSNNRNDSKDNNNSNNRNNSNDSNNRNDSKDNNNSNNRNNSNDSNNRNDSKDRNDRNDRNDSNNRNDRNDKNDRNDSNNRNDRNDKNEGQCAYVNGVCYNLKNKCLYKDGDKWMNDVEGNLATTEKDIFILNGDEVRNKGSVFRLPFKPFNVVGNEDEIAFIGSNEIIFYDRNMRKKLIIKERVEITDGFYTKNKNGQFIFIYGTLRNIKYVYEGIGILLSVDEYLRPVGICNNELYLLDGNGIRRIAVNIIEILFRKVVSEDGDIISFIKKNNIPGISSLKYLIEHGKGAVALPYINDPATKFDLYISSGDLENAYKICYNDKMRDKLGFVAMSEGNYKMAETCWNEIGNTQNLFYLYLCTKQLDKVAKLKDKILIAAILCEDKIYLNNFFRFDFIETNLDNLSIEKNNN